MMLFLGVMGTPLVPIHVTAMDHLPHICIKDTPIYVLQQYKAATSGQKMQNSIKSAYATGKLKMVASRFETASKAVKKRNVARDAESGGFKYRQMNPDMWYLELTVGGSKFAALKHISAIETTVSSAFAWFILGERWELPRWIGVALILGGSIIVQMNSNTSLNFHSGPNSPPTSSGNWNQKGLHNSDNLCSNSSDTHVKDSQNWLESHQLICCFAMTM